jgi:hypothetical protein
MRLVEPILKAYQEQSHLLVDKGMSLCPADQRIQVHVVSVPVCTLVSSRRASAPLQLAHARGGLGGRCVLVSWYMPVSASEVYVCVCVVVRAREKGRRLCLLVRALGPFLTKWLYPFWSDLSLPQN